MSADRRKRSGTAFLLALLLASAGCAHLSPDPLPSEAERASLGVVGISRGKYAPETTYSVPAKGPGEGALLGGGIAFGVPVAGGAQAGPYGLVLGAAVGAVLLPFGAMAGASSAMPIEEAKTSEAALREAVAGLGIQESLRNRVIAAAKDKAPTRTFRSVERGPADPSERAVYGPLAGEGVDSVLEIRATRLGLKGLAWGSDPPMEFFMDAAWRLVRTRDDADLHVRMLTYRGPALRFSEWAENDGKRLREESDRACGDLSEKAVEEVFLLVPLP